MSLWYINVYSSIYRNVPPGPAPTTQYSWLITSADEEADEDILTHTNKTVITALKKDIMFAVWEELLGVKGW